MNNFINRNNDKIYCHLYVRDNGIDNCCYITEADKPKKVTFYFYYYLFLYFTFCYPKNILSSF